MPAGTGVITTVPKFQFSDANGRPLALGTVSTYVTGTTTPSTTWQNKALDSANTNPIQLDANGECVIWLDPEVVYRFVLKNAAGSTMWTVDNISGAQQGGLDIALAAAGGSALVGYTPPGSGAVVRTVQSKLRDVVSVKDFGAVGDGVADDTTAIANALAAASSVYFPAGTYLANISVRKSNVTLIGEGSKSTTIKMPAGRDSIVLELGNTAAGNSAPEYTGICVVGFTLDGNYTNTPAPSDDLTGQAFIATKTSYCFWDDICCKNTHNAGFAVVINSNFNFGRVQVTNCGKTLVGGAYYPGFDVNSSKYNVFDVVADSCTNAGRLLDNCFGNQVRLVGYNTTNTGFTYNNQLVNESHSNILDVTLQGGCSIMGVDVDANCRSSTIFVSANGLTAPACRELGVNDGVPLTNVASGNNIFVTSRLGQSQAAIVNGIGSNWTISSYLDGRGGAQGDNFAVDVYGTKNNLTVTVQDSSPWQVRGVAFRSASSGNILTSYTFTNTADAYNDAGTGNVWMQRPVVWADATLGSGWNNSYAPPHPAAGYTRDALGRVSLRGVLNGGSGTALTLPVGFRPSATLLFPTVDGSGNGAWWQIDASGNLTLPLGTATACPISQITFETLA